MTEEAKIEEVKQPEPTMLQKVQAEYQRLCGLLGHSRAQKLQFELTNQKETKDLEDQLIKLFKKAENLPKETA